MTIEKRKNSELSRLVLEIRKYGNDYATKKAEGILYQFEIKKLATLEARWKLEEWFRYASGEYVAKYNES